MQIELRVLQQQVGITFVFVTHDQEEALTLSDRIAVMDKGVVLEIESPTQLYETPKTRFVADFIGTMNFFDGSVEEIGNETTTIDSGLLGKVRGASTPEIQSASKVTVGIRPEKLQLSLERPSQSLNAAPGKMGPSAYLGDRSHLYVYLEGREEPVSVALQNLTRSTSDLREPNRPVWLSWDEESVVLLPSQ